MYITYVIGKNDTLDLIAKKFNVSKENIINLNKLANDSLIAGASIMIPVLNKNYNYYQIKNGDTLYDISKIYSVDLELLAEINGLLTYDYLYPGQIIMIPKKGIKFYKTKDKDTLESVARKNNIRVESIIANNPNIYLMEEQLIAYRD